MNTMKKRVGRLLNMIVLGMAICTSEAFGASTEASVAAVAVVPSQNSLVSAALSAPSNVATGIITWAGIAVAMRYGCKYLCSACNATLKQRIGISASGIVTGTASAITAAGITYALSPWRGDWFAGGVSVFARRAGSHALLTAAGAAVIGAIYTNLPPKAQEKIEWVSAAIPALMVTGACLPYLIKAMN